MLRPLGMMGWIDPLPIWLEVANSGDYQIILPTLRVIGRETMAQLKDLFGDLG